MTSPVTTPEYADPDRYAELTAFKGGWRDLWWNPDFLDLIARRLDLASVHDALDVGCGAGHWTRTIARLLAPDAQITGVDREAAFLEYARADAPAHWSWRQAEAHTLPFPDASFDLVTCQTVLIHLSDPGRALAEWVRVLRPGGRLLLAEPDNLAGKVAHLGSDPAVPDADIETLVHFLLACQRGKRALGEGDDRIGARMPGLLAGLGLSQIQAWNNDRCVALHPPYASREMQVALQQELAWAREGITTLTGTVHDATRLFTAGGGEDLERCLAAVERWRLAFEGNIAAGTYHAARAYVMVVASGRR